MDTALLNPLDALEKSLNSLVQSLTTTNTFSNAPTATKDLLSADDALTSALTTLRKHQDNYSRIVKLRAEANKLNGQIKTIIRTCVDLRSEIGAIHPSILEDSDSDTDDEDTDREPKIQPVDYDTLLSFAARIGKHNVAAAREAEQESIRRQTAAKQKSEQSTQTLSQPQTLSQSTMNGTSTFTTTSTEANDTTQPTNQTATQESQAEVAAINENLSAQRAYHGMAFPAAERLRMGLLGQLQLLREQEGEDAADAEIERMVRESEEVLADEQEQQAVDLDEHIGADIPRTESAEVGVRSARPAPSTGASGPRPGPAASKKKINLDLDFPDSDEEE